jgi:hypothetical protein
MNLPLQFNPTQGKKGEGNFVKGHNHRWIERLYEAAHLAKDLVTWADQRQ